MTTLLASIAQHVPSDLYPTILDYADDSLDKFVELWDEDLKHDVSCGEHCTCENRAPEPWKSKYAAWVLYRNRHMSYCRGLEHWLCAASAYKAVKHKRRPLCRHQGNNLWFCESGCEVCGRAQFIEK